MYVCLDYSNIFPHGVFYPVPTVSLCHCAKGGVFTRIYRQTEKSDYISLVPFSQSLKLQRVAAVVEEVFSLLIEGICELISQYHIKTLCQSSSAEETGNRPIDLRVQGIFQPGIHFIKLSTINMHLTLPHNKIRTSSRLVSIYKIWFRFRFSFFNFVFDFHFSIPSQHSVYKKMHFDLSLGTFHTFPERDLSMYSFLSVFFKFFNGFSRVFVFFFNILQQFRYIFNTIKANKLM